MKKYIFQGIVAMLLMGGAFAACQKENLVTTATALSDNEPVTSRDSMSCDSTHHGHGHPPFDTTGHGGGHPPFDTTGHGGGHPPIDTTGGGHGGHGGHGGGHGGH